MTDMIFHFFLGSCTIILVIAVIFCCVYSNESERGAFIGGVITTLLIIASIVSGCDVSDEKTTYLNDSYNYQIEKADKVYIDTTFITNNTKTDTIYTIYYNYKISE